MLPNLTAAHLFEAILAIALVFSCLLGLQVIRERRPPAVTLAWVAVLVLLPMLGVLLYLLFGTRKRWELRVRQRPVIGCETAVRPFDDAHVLDRMLRRLALPPALSGNDIRCSWRPEVARRDLLDVIDGATERLWMFIYMFEDDASGALVLDALIAAASRGVRVRVMVDDLGSFGSLAAGRRALEAAGGRMVRFKPVWYALRKRMLNLRNHRKIVVADGQVAWTGGRNVGDHYLAAGKHEWLDFSAVIRGPTALALEEICRNDWRFASDEPPDSSPVWVSGPQGNACLQVLPAGPEYRDDAWQTALVKCCFEAHSRLWLATPYFVPDETVTNAVLTAARSGVDVRILVPHRSDNLVVDLVGRSFLREVQRAGGKVFRYKIGMMHAKAVLVDDTLAMFGSANIDARSLFLNYECMVIGYDAETVIPVQAFFEYAFARASRGVRTIGQIRETLSSLARLLAPLL
ncbi:phospholipase D-like domain-containing protein [Ahniella affigens]|uniref:phospholipase D-like domain-containing protein n=1 Tax=Ahniella affigens TaxID=2021234 RepID=UPI0011B2215C|nr:phospholipase D-like domain-containing protein [Ahniella affigens]